MCTRPKWGLETSRAGMIGLVALGLLAEAESPQGWILRGSAPESYETGMDAEQDYQGHASAYLKGKQKNMDGFGTLMQTIHASHYAGKRVRLSTLVKAEDVAHWAGLWMRIDRNNADGIQSIGLDNMMHRPIHGSLGWKRFDMELFVPKDASSISFGILVRGTGEVWLNNTKLETIEFDAPRENSGGKAFPDVKVNLEFAD